MVDADGNFSEIPSKFGSLIDKQAGPFGDIGNDFDFVWYRHAFSALFLGKVHHRYRHFLYDLNIRRYSLQAHGQLSICPAEINP